MKLINETDYDTRTLRSMLCAVHAAESKTSRGKLRTWNRLVVRITYRKKGNRELTGHAYYNGLKSHLSIPRDEMSVQGFVALWRHELWHLYGVRHPDYPESIMWCRHTEWTAGFEERFGTTIEAKKIAAPTVDEKKDAKLAAIELEIERARARVGSWGTKLKRAKNGLKKAERDVKRAEKRLLHWQEKPVEMFERKAARPKVHK